MPEVLRGVELGLDADPAEAASRVLGVSRSEIRHVDVLRRSLDARRRPPCWIVTLRVTRAGEPPPGAVPLPEIPEVTVRNRDQRVVIVGAGPAGLFAALRFADAGVPCRVVDRGSALSERHQRARLLRAERLLDPESNLCFGEGGAGTYSDGKLYTRKKDPRVREVYRRLVDFGADPEILVDAHPHVGTNRLIPLLRSLHAHLESRSIEMQFDCRLDELVVQGGRLRALVCGGEEIPCDAAILATGHSARDTYALLARHGVAMQPKAFAVGARIEHPQSIVDSIQLGRWADHPGLDPAEYFLRCRVGDRGVYSFCMCPGGFVIPTPTEIGHLNVNGMSNQSRKNRFANAALVVTVEPFDYAPTGDPLEGLTFQREIERAAFVAGGSDYSAPAMRITDLVGGRASGSLPARTSYRPSLTPYDVGEVLPPLITAALVGAIRRFDRQMRGYLTSEAVVIAAETTTSSPIRILRGDDLQSVSLRGLYPTGEGAGYAGGIVSSALDGMRVAERILGG